LATIGNLSHIRLVELLLNLHRLGVGGILPKDVADGSFTKRTVTFSDKLLEQLLGKKKAKAHLAAKEHAERLGAQPQPKNGRREAPKKEESEDEEEGRAAAFKSKRRKVGKSKPVLVSEEEAEEEEAGAPVTEEAGAPVTEEAPQEDQEQADAPAVQLSKEDDNGQADTVPALPKSKAIPSRGRAKPTSYLDEILAERSKKKKNKSKNKPAEDS
jgi:hypothetical protein